MALIRWAAVCVLFLLPARALAGSDEAREHRRGFTMEYSLSLGLDHTDVGILPASWEWGTSYFNLGLGTFLDPDLAIGFRLSGLNTDVARFGSIRKVDTFTELSSIYVASWRYAPIELVASAGVARLDSELVFTNPQTGERFFDEDYGWGVGLGAYAPLTRQDRDRVEIGLEWRMMMFDHVDVHQLSLHLGYQLF